MDANLSEKSERGRSERCKSDLTGANLSEIIIDEKAFSTLDISEHTFMNKSTLAEETKKKKEQALRKKKEQALRKKKEQALRKKKEQALRKKKEQALRKKKEKALRKKKEKELRKKNGTSTSKEEWKQALRKKKEKELRKKMEDGYKDIKFNMDDETAFIILKSKCSFAYKDKFEDYGKISGSQCYKIMGEKRSIELKFRHDCFKL